MVGSLIGRWELKGQVGTLPLRQEVSAGWSLGGRYVEARFRSLAGQAPYEAVIYLAALPAEEGYVMHQLDSRDVALEGAVARGRRVKDSLRFTLPGAEGQAHYTWHYAAGEDTWRLEHSREQDGQATLLSTAEMKRLAWLYSRPAGGAGCKLTGILYNKPYTKTYLTKL